MLGVSIAHAIGTGVFYYVIYILAAILMVGLALGSRLDVQHHRSVILVAATAIFTLVVVLSNGTPFGDFVKAYYPAGNLIVKNPDNVYFCAVSNACFVNLPILAILFTPFSQLPLATAEALFTIVGLWLIAWSAWRMSRGAHDWKGGAVIIGLFALNGPLAYSLRLGNTTHHLLLVLLVGFEAAYRGKRIIAGVAMGFAALIKPLLALFLFYFLLRRQFRIAAAMMGTACAVILASVILLGPDINVVFLRRFVLGFGSKPVIAYNVQNFSGMIGHLLMPGNLNNWIPLDEPMWFKASRISLSAIAALLVGFVFFRVSVPRQANEWMIELSAVLCLALLVAPVTWTHYLCLLLIPLSQFAIGRFPIPVGWTGKVAVVCTALLLSLPVLILPHNHLRFFTERLWISHYVWGAMLLLGLLLWGRIRIANAGAISARAVSARFESVGIPKGGVF